MSIKKRTIPQFLTVPVVELFALGPLFKSATEALEWVNNQGSSALKAEASQLIVNLLSAGSSERNERGMLIATRAILAQAAWLQCLDTWAPQGRVDMLKKHTSAIRDAEAPTGAHEQAKAQLLSKAVELTATRVESDKIIGQILLLCKEESFMAWAVANLYGWQVTATELVVAGSGLRVSGKSLELTLLRLQKLERRYFGESLPSSLP